MIKLNKNIHLNAFLYYTNKPMLASYANKYLYWKKIYLVGLGYKNFIIDNQLYILVGNANYILYEIPKSIFIVCKKNQIFLFSLENQILNTFVNQIKTVKRLNLYKGKGLVEFRNFKFMRLKIGKKQKFS